MTSADLYRLFLSLLQPVALAVVLVLAAAAFRRRAATCHLLLAGAFLVLMVCGNGWVADAFARSLESRHPNPDPVPEADCIVVLGGGTGAAIPPRTTVEVGEAGDRVLFAGHLFRIEKAPIVICTSGVATGGLATRPPAEDMAELLQAIGVPEEAILLETESANTREHAVNLAPILRERGFKRAILVTSALHMPRAVGVFKRYCPDLEWIPAPTDYRVVEQAEPLPWYREARAFVPSPGNLQLFSETAHEYLGMAYYRLRGWW
ncbi:MAG: YdcF family protein [Verrucomicrobiae bacterium]|nr:YdcF family protein [Verrucomicrobiae bacterium]